MPENRVGGTAYLRVDGRQYDVVGDFTYNLGHPMREPKIGAATVHGYIERPQPSVIEGEITDMRDLKVADLVRMEGVTVTLELANGKTVVQPDAWYSHEGNVTTENGNVQFRTHSRRQARETS